MRQSPCATASESTMPTASGLLKVCSQFFSHLARARCSSASLTGSLAKDSMVSSMAARAGCGSAPGGSCAPSSSTEGSASPKDSPKVLAASCFSVSRLCRRPEGESPRMSASRSAAAASGCPAGGTW